MLFDHCLDVDDSGVTEHLVTNETGEIQVRDAAQNCGVAVGVGQPLPWGEGGQMRRAFFPSAPLLHRQP